MERKKKKLLPVNKIGNSLGIKFLFLLLYFTDHINCDFAFCFMWTEGKSSLTLLECGSKCSVSMDTSTSENNDVESKTIRKTSSQVPIPNIQDVGKEDET